METRANFILIGAFTLAGILGTLGFLVWLANVQLDRQYAYYGILFGDVSGLDASGDVFFNGIRVGKVIERRIYLPDPSKVYVDVEVDAATPVRADTVAQLSSSGVTGVSFISLSNSGLAAPPLETGPDDVPIIPSRASSLQQLVDTAPDILTEAKRLLEDMRKIAGPENVGHVTSILRNVDNASARLDVALADISAITTIASDATAKIFALAGRLDMMMAAANQTLGNADRALASATGAFDGARQTIDRIEPDVTTLTARLGPMVDGAEGALASASRLLDRAQTTLSQIDGTLASANAALGSADTAFTSATDLLSTDVGPVLDDLRTTTARIRTAMERVADEIPGVTSDLRVLITRAGDVVKQVQETVAAAAPGIRSFSERGLAELNGLSAEARTLVQSLSQLVRRIDRNPAEFLLNNRVPEYRR